MCEITKALRFRSVKRRYFSNGLSQIIGDIRRCIFEYRHWNSHWLWAFTEPYTFGFKLLVRKFCWKFADRYDAWKKLLHIVGKEIKKKLPTRNVQCHIELRIFIYLLWILFQILYCGVLSENEINYEQIEDFTLNLKPENPILTEYKTFFEGFLQNNFPEQFMTINTETQFAKDMIDGNVKAKFGKFLSSKYFK